MRDNDDGKHYRHGGIEPVDYIVSHKMSFAEGNVVKYITRYKHKGDPVGDLEKVLFYVNELVQAQKLLLATPADTPDEDMAGLDLYHTVRNRRRIRNGVK